MPASHHRHATRNRILRVAMDAASKTLDFPAVVTRGSHVISLTNVQSNKASRHSAQSGFSELPDALLRICIEFPGSSENTLVALDDEFSDPLQFLSGIGGSTDGTPYRFETGASCDRYRVAIEDVAGAVNLSTYFAAGGRFFLTFMISDAGFDFHNRR